MKKTLIISAIALSALSYTFAQDAAVTTTAQASTTVPMPPALPPVITTGSSTIDAQIKSLRVEMEAKIKAIRDDYQARLKTIIGNRMPLTRPDGATTTVKEIRKEIKDVRKDNMDARKEARVEGDSTTTITLQNAGNGKLMNLLRSFFGR
jgi:hypothetical protein